ncbi:MAG TPA: ABC transporter permease [Anaerolineaceae bacterium]|nr:ABC transporter permease [Anaerolineaceae bacterium]
MTVTETPTTPQKRTGFLPKYKLERVPAPYWVKILLPFLSILLTFLISSIFLLLSGVNPLEAYYYFLIEPLSTQYSAIEVLVKSIPVLLTGVAAAVAFASGYWNIGGEGQLVAGAIAGAGLGMVFKDASPFLTIPSMVLGGFLAGAAWAFIPAILKVKLSVDEIVTTLLMNSIVLYVVSYLLNGPWRSPLSGWPQSPEIDASTHFIKLIPRTRLHIGFLIALLVIFLVWFILNRTSLGYTMRAAGMGKNAANFAGLKVSRTILITALMSGGIAGIAGVSEVAGIHYHLIEAIASGLGYTGVIVATLSQLNPIGVIPSALFIGLIDTGSQSVSRALGVPIHLGDVVQSTLLLVILGMFLLQNYRIRRVK